MGMCCCKTEKKLGDEELGNLFKCFQNIIIIKDLDQLQQKNNKIQSKGGKVEEEEKEEYLPSSVESSEEDDDYVDELPVKLKTNVRKHRSSVSAEVFGLHNKREDYVPRVIKKTEE